MWKNLFYSLKIIFFSSSHSQMLCSLCARKRNTLPPPKPSTKTCTNGASERAPKSKQVIEFWINNVSKMESTLFFLKTLFLLFFRLPFLTFPISIQIFSSSACSTRRFPFFLATRIWRFIIHTFNFVRSRNKVNKYKSSFGTGCEEFRRNITKKWCDSRLARSEKRVNCKW